MTRPYPAFLRLYGRPVLVIGGGPEALEPAIALGEAGARITVVDRDAHPDMENIPGVERVLRRPFKVTDVTHGFGGRRPRLVVACADETTNLCAARAAERAGVWTAAPGTPALGSFVLPAVAREAKVTFAVVAENGGPFLEKFIASRLASAFGPSVSALAKVLKALAPRLKTLPPDLRRRLVEKVLDRVARGDIRPGGGSRPARKIRRSPRTSK
jgi:siroheme synthase-like protein